MDTGNAAWVADRRLGRRVLAVAAVAVVFVVYVAHGALPVTPFSLPFTGERHYAKAFAPQSWAFFTRSPRTPELVAVGRGADGSWRRLSPGHLAVPADLMGLDRVRQAEEMHVRNLRVQVPDSAWSACDGAPADCLSRLPAGATVVNYSTRRELCGDVGLILQEVLPWAWRDLPTVMPSQVARVTVTC
ncbi:SdpA family antimicrobial peptide system protein [Phytohabitans sp. LJ34]|uniref:SdpA family antimicrobial peptide system protein n=1 Tax=Phytohabitans sp. LJ34 TaxID=3452217 RepID=UPI003F8B69F8